MVSIVLLLLRLVVGGLMAGHGAQKLFGAYGGYGIEGTAGYMESLGLKPGRQYAQLAGVAEFGGGALTALGLLHPLGPLGIAGSMAMATATQHRGKSIWAESGGAELPVTNLAVASALILAGPGNLALDKVLGTGLPRWLGPLGLAAVAAVVSSQAPAAPAPAAPAETGSA